MSSGRLTKTTIKKCFLLLKNVKQTVQVILFNANKLPSDTPNGFSGRI